MAIDGFYILSTFTTKPAGDTSEETVRSNIEGPQVPQVTYGKGREGNAFVSQCLPSTVSPVHAKIRL